MTLFDRQDESAGAATDEEKATPNPAPIEQMKGTNLKEIPPQDV